MIIEIPLQRNTVRGHKTPQIFEFKENYVIIKSDNRINQPTFLKTEVAYGPYEDPLFSALLALHPL